MGGSGTINPAKLRPDHTRIASRVSTRIMLPGLSNMAQHDYPSLARRDDKQVSYAFAAKQGRRGNMEDFTFAQARYTASTTPKSMLHATHFVPRHHVASVHVVQEVQQRGTVWFLWRVRRPRRSWSRGVCQVSAIHQAGRASKLPHGHVYCIECAPEVTLKLPVLQ